MSHARLYRQWMSLCKKWGLDESKSGRDLGQFVRQEVGIAFRDAEMTKLPNPEECEEKLKCMERIVNNKYYQTVDADLPTSSGLTKEELHISASNEALEFAKYLYDASAYQRLRFELSMRFSSPDHQAESLKVNQGEDKSHKT
jgi:hypothetical protein